MKTEHRIIVLLFLIHLVGILGYISPVQDSFKLLSPFSIISIVTIIIYNQPKKTTALYFCFGAIVLAGFFVEVTGVSSGKIFGNYHYGITLGKKVLEVPPIIGFNWLMLIMAAGQIVNQCKFNIWLQALLGSFLLVVLDFLIEPIAIQYDFWSWGSNEIPLQNYFAWLLVSFLFLLFYLKINAGAKNRVAQWLYVFQIIFFLSLNLLQ